MHEPSFADQLRAVKAGRTEEIHVSASPISDRDLTAAAGATALRVLKIDHVNSRITAAGLGHLKSLPNLEHLRIRGAGADDDALAELAAIKSLKILNLPQADFTDAGLSQLKGLPNLIQLRFGSPRVTDTGMKTIAELPALLRLHLIDVPIGDQGLASLAQMKQLESLYIDGGEFSDEAVNELFQKRPDLHVHLNQEHHDRDPHRHEHPK
jgi:hypothetical protein